MVIKTNTIIPSITIRRAFSDLNDEEKEIENWEENGKTIW